MKLHTVLFCYCLFTGNFYPCNAVMAANTVAELQQSGRLNIRSWLEPAEQIITTQQIKLQIEIATDTWFSGGTRIGRVLVKDAIVLQREKFALNSSRYEDGKNWTLQQWTLVLYPQRSGAYTIPEIPVTVSIAGGNGVAVSGQLHTPVMTFVAQMPGEMVDKKHWIASPRFKVEQTFDQSLNDLKQGDALVRTVTLSAEDVPAMMLQEVNAVSTPGVAVYEQPATVIDKVNRGDYLARRTQKISYVFEQAGDFKIPGQTWYWWNLQSNTAESLELPPLDVNISAAASGQQSADIDPKQTATGMWQHTSKLIAVIALFLLIVWIGKRWFSKDLFKRKQKKSRTASATELRKKMFTACCRGDFYLALGLFYRYLDHHPQASYQGSVRRLLISGQQLTMQQAFEQLMRQGYKQHSGNTRLLQHFIKQFFQKYGTVHKKRWYKRRAVQLKLN